MPASSYMVGYYIYLLVVIGVFLYNCRSWTFIRMTILYYFFITLFACLLIYGSAYSLESNLVQWHKEGWLAAFPLTITGGAPDANTIAKNSSVFWQYLIPLLTIFVTFPQAVTRSAGLHQAKTPQAVMEQVTQTYNRLRPMFAFFKSWLPGTISNAYDIGEWIFVLIALTSLASPFPNQNLPLMLFGCFFVVLLAGSDLVTGMGLVSLILKLLIPSAISAMQRFVVFVLRLIVYLCCILLALGTGLSLYMQAQQIFHTQSPNGFIIVIVLILALGVLVLSFAFLWKIITFPTKKLIEWMQIEVIDSI